MMMTDEQMREAHSFYREALSILVESGEDFLLGGGFALFHYTGLFRDTKDLDIFCTPTQYAGLMKLFASHGYEIVLTDARWLAKVFKGEYYIDIIFNSTNNICLVDESWYEHAVEVVFMGLPIRLIAPEELIWSKVFIQNRERFDGADVNHVMLRYGKQLNWERLLRRCDPHWHLLLAQLLVFQFVYPADYTEIIPRWLFDELMQRARDQYELPPSQEKVCRGPLIDQTQYAVDITDWHYKGMTIKTV
ncbi:nucleotidyltransferase [Chitinophaga filiformis]|nr:nucleotidyltransferase [Chitinophaga filiformis]